MSQVASAGSSAFLGAVSTSEPPPLSQPRRLAASLDKWRAAGASSSLLSDLVLGCRWRWARRQPPRLRLPNPPLEAEQACALRFEVERLVALGALRLVAAQPYLCLPVFVVPKSSGSWRLVHDLRFLNRFLEVPRFRVESLDAVAALVQSGDLSATTDLADAYCHLPVHRRFQRFLGFSLEGRFYVWTCLPFGLALSPRLFTKALRPVLAQLRSLGLRVTSFYDDFLLAAQPPFAAEHLRLLRSELQAFGFRLKESKLGALASCTKYLGVLVDTSGSPTFRPAPETRVDLRRLSRSVRKDQVVQARRLAGLLGLANFFARSVPSATLFVRRLQHLLRRKRRWSDLLPLTDAEVEDLVELERLVRNPVSPPLRRPPPGLQLVTDASEFGWGAWLTDGGPPAAGQWSQEDAQHSSNWRELQAVRQAVQSFAPRLQGQQVQLQSDNQVTVSYVRRLGGRSEALHEVARSLLLECRNLSVSLLSVHLPGSSNEVADFLSRPDNYGLCVTDSVWLLEKQWLGPSVVDAFATDANAVCSRFWARVLLPGAEAADALAQSWTGETLWLFPPFPVLWRVLQKLVEEPPRRASLLLPAWPAQGWFYPLLRAARSVRWLPQSPPPVLKDPVQPAPPGFSSAWTWVVCRFY